jgi:hypothetical protein
VETNDGTTIELLTCVLIRKRKASPKCWFSWKIRHLPKAHRRDKRL